MSRRYDSIVSKYDICVTGDALQQLANQKLKRLHDFISKGSVFARTSPDQKVVLACFLVNRNMITYAVVIDVSSRYSSSSAREQETRILKL
jgi:magnesium-transporting ATPase (P-type)